MLSNTVRFSAFKEGFRMRQLKPSLLSSELATHLRIKQLAQQAMQWLK